jgi:hypothetical protein
VILFRWLFTDGVATATFARATDATFDAYTPDAPDPIRAYDLSRPFVLARPVDGGTTL